MAHREAGVLPADPVHPMVEWAGPISLYGPAPDLHRHGKGTVIPSVTNFYISPMLSTRKCCSLKHNPRTEAYCPYPDRQIDKYRCTWFLIRIMWLGLYCKHYQPHRHLQTRMRIMRALTMSCSRHALRCSPFET